KILAWKEEKLSIRETARRLQRSDSTIRAFLKSPDTYKTKKWSGRKTRLLKRDIRRIFRNSLVHNYSAEKSAKTFSRKISGRT
ncbi:unnamed protein product, partial [Aphanomyces euteiches]